MASTNPTKARSTPKLVFLTAGAAGMYCGSCMHDNAIAKAMLGQGVDCLLQPIYTPIRTDGDSVASDRVFFGGIHIYLLQKFPWLKHVASPLRHLLNSPSLIKLATRRQATTDPAMLGELAVSMLRGDQGKQSDEVDRLVRWLADDIKPDAIVLSNLLIGGSLPAIRKALPETRIAVILQGDDIFLDHLPEPHQSEAVRMCRQLVASVDHFITNSKFYSAKMGDHFRIPANKLNEIPLSIDTTPFKALPTKPIKPADDPFRLGYLARIAPEKGFHHLVRAFITLASQAEHDDLFLHVAGWLGPQNQDYFDQQFERINSAGLGDRFIHHGSPSLDQKTNFLGSLDLLCVPTEYHEPKGLFALESMAAGVPVAQPHHGAFAELIQNTGGGVTYDPSSHDAICTAIADLKQNHALRQSLGQTGRSNVLKNHSVESTATQLLDLLLRSVDQR